MSRLPFEHGERGQSLVESFAVFPAVLLAGLLCFQALSLGAGAVAADHAAHAAAVAWANGGAPAARVAARRSVPGWSRSRLKVSFGSQRAKVALEPRAVVPLDLPTLRASAPLPVVSGAR